MFRIKICGITNIADARNASAAGADAIGLNFFSLGKRPVAVAEAQKIARAVNNSCLKVGVFVDQSAGELNTIADQVGLDIVQLHGDQSPSYLLEVNSQLPIMRVFRIGQAGLLNVKADLIQCEQCGRNPAAVLVDSVVPGEFGGTGQCLNWKQLADQIEILNSDRARPLRLILAGGLTPENVAQAIQEVRPYGVDVASGVEASPGRKDTEKVKAFVAAARRGFAEIGVEQGL